MMLGIVIAAATATLLTICFGYAKGAANLHTWFFLRAPVFTFDWGLYGIEHGAGPNMQGHFWAAVAAAIMGALMLAQRALFWWPIHPVGFIVCSVEWTDHYWFSIFLAWLIKSLLVRLGGNRALRLGRRFFLGMILGQYTAAGVWAVIDTITGKFFNQVMSI